jgi:hypothetical protein
MSTYEETFLSYDRLLHIYSADKEGRSNHGYASFEALADSLYSEIVEFGLACEQIQDSFLAKDSRFSEEDQAYVVQKLNDTSDTQITRENAIEYVNELQACITPVYQFAVKNYMKFGSREAINKVNEAYAKENGLEYEDPTIEVTEEDKEYLKTLAYELKEGFYKTVQDFDKKYLTSNNKFVFSSKPIEYWETEEGKTVKYDICKYIAAIFYAEHDSTELKLEYYQGSLESRMTLDKISKEIGLDIRDLIDKSEYEYKHRTRESIVPYGALDQFTSSLKHFPVDPDNLTMWDKYVQVNQMVESDLIEYLSEPDRFFEALEALYEAKKEKRSQEDMSLEEVVRIEYEDIFKAIKNKLKYKMYQDFDQLHTLEDYNKFYQEFDYREAAELVVSWIKEDKFEELKKEGFKEQLIQSVMKMLENDQDKIKSLALMYKERASDIDNLEERFRGYMSRIYNRINSYFVGAMFAKNDTVVIEPTEAYDRFKRCVLEAGVITDLKDPDQKEAMQRIISLHNHNLEIYEQQKDNYPNKIKLLKSKK